MKFLGSNERLDTVVTFTPDPRGWRMFAGLARRNLRDITGGSRVYIDARGEHYSGLATTVQKFTGLAGLNRGRQRVIASTTSNDLVNERSTGNATAMKAFYEQLSRRQGT